MPVRHQAIEAEIEKLKSDSAVQEDTTAHAEAIAAMERELEECKAENQKKQDAQGALDESSHEQQIEKYEQYVKLLGGGLAGASLITLVLLL